MLTLKSDSTRGPCGSKTSSAWSSVTTRFFYSPCKALTLKPSPETKACCTDILHEWKQNKHSNILLLVICVCKGDYKSSREG